MARPKSYGIDYFTFNVDFFEDPKLLFVANRFEEKGELITVKLLCWIFKNQGYYMEWNDELAMLFSKRAFVNIKYSLVNDVVNELIKREFFNRQMFNSFGILTSNGIQKRWVEATKRRTVKIKSKYNCIDKDTETPITDTETPITDTEKKAEPPEIPQSKEEYSKVKESKEEKRENAGAKTPKISLAYDLIKLEKPEALNIFEMQHKNQIKNWDKLIKSFNNKIELELSQNKIAFESEQLFPRFKGFSDNWISNEEKYNKTPEVDSYESGKLPRF